MIVPKVISSIIVVQENRYLCQWKGSRSRLFSCFWALNSTDQKNLVASMQSFKKYSSVTHAKSVISGRSQIFLIYKKLEGWTGGVWHWIIFSLGFQHIFSSKTATKALDRVLGFV